MLVADGVEIDEQARALRELGCPLAQGYVYSRPKPAAEPIAELARTAAAVRA